MSRPTTIVLLLIGAAQAGGQSTPAKSKLPEAQQQVVERLDRIESMYRQASAARFPIQRQEALDRILAEVKSLRADLNKRLTKDGVTDWLVEVTSNDDDHIQFEVGPGLTLKVSRVGMDGLTLLAVRKLVMGDKVLVSLAPALIADVQGEGTRLVAAVGGKHLTIKRRNSR